MQFAIKLTAALLFLGLAACQTTRDPPEATDPELLEKARAFIAARCVIREAVGGYVRHRHKMRDIDIFDIDYGHDSWLRVDMSTRRLRSYSYVRQRDALVVCSADDWYLGLTFYETPQAYAEATGRPWLGLATETAKSGWQSRRITVQWEGYSDAMAGWLFYRPQGKGGTIDARLPDGEGLCRGEYEHSSPTTQDWTIACDNGLSANGTTALHGAGKGATGSGTDAQGRAVTFTIAGN